MRGSRAQALLLHRCRPVIPLHLLRRRWRPEQRPVRGHGAGPAVAPPIQGSASSSEEGPRNPLAYLRGKTQVPGVSNPPFLHLLGFVRSCRQLVLVARCLYEEGRKGRFEKRSQRKGSVNSRIEFGMSCPFPAIRVASSSAGPARLGGLRNSWVKQTAVGYRGAPILLEMDAGPEVSRSRRLARMQSCVILWRVSNARFHSQSLSAVTFLRFLSGFFSLK